MRTFTKDTAQSEQGWGAARHVWINERHGRGTACERHGAACYVWINERHGRGTAWERHGAACYVWIRLYSYMNIGVFWSCSPENAVHINSGIVRFFGAQGKWSHWLPPKYIMNFKSITFIYWISLYSAHYFKTVECSKLIASPLILLSDPAAPLTPPPPQLCPCV
jgi:hypothetical protein